MFCVVVYHDYMHNTYSNKPTAELNFIEVIDESIVAYVYSSQPVWQGPLD